MKASNRPVTGQGVAEPPRSKTERDARMAAFHDRLRGGPRVDHFVRLLRSPPIDLIMPGYRALFAAVVDSLPRHRLALLGVEPTGFGPLHLPARRLVGSPSAW